MGRLKIKKKEGVLPFRETVAFRFLMVALSAVLFLIAAFQLPRAIRDSNTTLLVLSIVLTLGAGALALFHLSRLTAAKIPKSARDRMKRARR